MILIDYNAIAISNVVTQKLELDENLETNFKRFEAAPQDVRATPGTASKK